MKSSLFPHKPAFRRGNHNSAAGNSSGGNAARGSNDGYETGMVGWRWSRRGGGQTLGQGMAGRPIANDKSLTGEGGFACDSATAKYLYDKGKPPDAKGP